jgi:hypothetical protein
MWVESELGIGSTFHFNFLTKSVDRESIRGLTPPLQRLRHLSITNSPQLNKEYVLIMVTTNERIAESTISFAKQAFIKTVNEILHIKCSNIITIFMFMYSFLLYL